jgi:hypothetical protein
VIDKNGGAFIALFLVSAHLSWAKNPALINAIWLIETVSPGLVAMKTL